MAVRALHPVDIVLALGGGEGGVHLLHVQPAVRHLGMAGGAGRLSGLPVLRVAGHATNTFVDAHARAVVADRGTSQ
jgi:hypothetical protein